MMIKVIITGCFGRIGSELIQLLDTREFSDIELIAGICKSEQLRVAASFKLGSDLAEYISETDVVIDFSAPDASMQFAEICASNGKAFVCGTTGFSNADLAKFAALAKQIPIFVSANMSVGMAKFAQIVAQASKLFKEDYDVDILEMHHNQKVDAPSGTAKMLGGIVATANGTVLDEVMTTSKNHKRNPNEIGFSSIRGGSVIGEHSVIFAGNLDVITLSHQALSRSQFAHGALSAARWIVSQPSGKVYAMESFLSKAT